jgi:cyclopropane fatty-acyl-phospholipid synthase-like methyltransferase
MDTYYPEAFNAANMDEAKRLATSSLGQHSAEWRWEHETPYLTDLIVEQLGITDKSYVLDYGCGAGRMAKALIDRTGCKVMGVDISQSMLNLAVTYVNSDKFSVSTPQVFREVTRARCFDAAIAIWCFQHCLDPRVDVATVARSLVPNGKLFVVSGTVRYVPITDGWRQDDHDVEDILIQQFDTGRSSNLRLDLVDGAVDSPWWGVYQT